MERGVDTHSVLDQQLTCATQVGNEGGWIQRSLYWELIPLFPTSRSQTKTAATNGFRSSCGRHLTKVRHEGRPVSRAEGARVDGGTTGVGREGEVRGDPGDGGDETRDTSKRPNSGTAQGCVETNRTAVPGLPTSEKRCQSFAQTAHGARSSE